jgi:hypothetical protein
MTHADFIGNFNEQFNCEEFLAIIKAQTGDKRNPLTPYGAGVELDAELALAKKEMQENWQNAGYLENNSVEWINYYPEDHFDRSYVQQFADLVNADPLNIWVSTIPVGKCVPWHWDIIKDYKNYKNDPSMVRYSFFLDKPQIGQVFILNTQAFHFVEQGAVYKWHKWDEWHLGFNCGFETKYMFHFVGKSRQ